jgi:hypothetical protein
MLEILRNLLKWYFHSLPFSHSCSTRALQ